MHAPNKKDAMTSRCLDREEVRYATWQVHSGTGLLVGSQRTHIKPLFLSSGRPVCAVGLAIVHWIGCINEIKTYFNKML